MHTQCYTQQSHPQSHQHSLAWFTHHFFSVSCVHRAAQLKPSPNVELKPSWRIYFETTPLTSVYVEYSHLLMSGSINVFISFPWRLVTPHRFATHFLCFEGTYVLTKFEPGRLLHLVLLMIYF